MTILREELTSKTFIEYTEGRSSIVSGSNSISTTEDAGSFINGVLSISAKPTNVRIGGIYTFHPLTLTGIPSNNITPIPTFKISIPIKGLKTVSSITSVLRGLL